MASLTDSVYIVDVEMASNTPASTSVDAYVDVVLEIGNSRRKLSLKLGLCSVLSVLSEELGKNGLDGVFVHLSPNKDTEKSNFSFNGGMRNLASSM